MQAQGWPSDFLCSPGVKSERERSPFHANGAAGGMAGIGTALKGTGVHSPGMAGYGAVPTYPKAEAVTWAAVT